MERNGVRLCVPEGTEDEAGYVHLAHGMRYTIEITNFTGRRGDAQISLNGDRIGVFRVGGSLFDRTIRLERPGRGYGDGELTAVARDSVEGQAGGLQAVEPDRLGLIELTFTPELLRVPQLSPQPQVARVPAAPARIVPLPFSGSTAARVTRGSTTYNAKARSAVAGGTVQTGHSSQQFTDAPVLPLDQRSAVTLALRIAIDPDLAEVRPLGARAAVPPPLD